MCRLAEILKRCRGAVLLGVVPPLDMGLNLPVRVGQADTTLESPWVLLTALVAFILLAALGVFLLWANDVPVPSWERLRRAPEIVRPRHDDHPPVHMPPPSYWPIVLAGAITLIGIGFLSHWVVALIGILATVGSIIGWALEPTH